MIYMGGLARLDTLLCNPRMFRARYTKNLQCIHICNKNNSRALAWMILAIVEV